MATDRDYYDYIKEQLEPIEEVSLRAMMGEYIIYFREKVVGGIYENRLLVKPTVSALRIIPDAPREIPHEKAKPMLLVEEVEDSELLRELLQAIYNDLPMKKK